MSFKEGTGLPAEFFCLHELAKKVQEFVADGVVQFDAYVTALQKAGFFDLNPFDHMQMGSRQYSSDSELEKFRERSIRFRLVFISFYHPELVKAYILRRITQKSLPEQLHIEPLSLFGMAHGLSESVLKSWVTDPMYYRDPEKISGGFRQFPLEMHLETLRAIIKDPHFFLSFYVWEEYLKQFTEEMVLAMKGQGISALKIRTGLRDRRPLSDERAFDAQLKGNSNYVHLVMPAVVFQRRERLLGQQEKSTTVDQLAFIAEDFIKGIEFAKLAGVFQFQNGDKKSTCAADVFLSELLPQMLPIIYEALRNQKISGELRNFSKVMQKEAEQVLGEVGRGK
jgi:hypothetical protein